MRKLNQTGSLLVPFVILLVLFLGAAGFGGWAFMGRQDYKNNSDDKADVAAKKAAAAEAIKKEAEFAEELKSPVKSYSGPETYGSLKFDFPKTWNQYVASPSAAALINLYFNPDFVPDVSSATQFAFRAQISGQTYTAILKTYAAAVKTGAVTIEAYRAPKVPSVLGSMLRGVVQPKTGGILVLLPIRDKTIILWTEGPNNTNDFLNTVLPSVSFSP